FYFLTANNSGLMILLQPDEALHARMDLPPTIFAAEHMRTSARFFATLHLESVAANYAKGLLLAGTEYARKDIEALSARSNFFLAGHPSWPWAIAPIDAAMLPALAQTTIDDYDVNNIAEQNGTFLIIGLGSLGSVIAETLNRLGSNLVL